MRVRKEGIFVVVLTIIAVLATGSSAAPPQIGGLSEGQILSMSRIQLKHEMEIMGRPGVLAFGIGMKGRQPAFVVLVDKNNPGTPIPSQIEGVPVDVRPSPKLMIHSGGSACNPCHADQLGLPTLMGHSTSNNNLCFAGTLGFVACETATSIRGYVTNNHVATAAPNTLCENGPVNSAQRERANLDAGCSFSGTQIIGTLKKYITLSGSTNLVDAAFVTSAGTQTSTSIEDIGVPSDTPGTVNVGDCVKKSGRTSGLTFARVTAINASVLISGYCGGDYTFNQQIIYQADGTCGIGPISMPGDSGSPVLNSSNQIVALNFAGGGSGTGNIGIGNTVQNVLSQLGLTLGECPTTPPPPPPSGCPATTAMQGAPDSASMLELLHQFRDQVLASSPRGQDYASLFVRNSPEGVTLMLRDSQIRDQSRALIEHFAPAIQAVVLGRPVTISDQDLSLLDRWFTTVSPRVSPKLRAAIDTVRADVRNPQVLSEFGVRIAR